ncbi:MAG: isocitrate/isopropylmalate family dehydrogenase, partial [Candidatus Latescibacterota bacterium]
MKTLRIALYAGDGIGVDVVEQAVHVLQHVEDLLGSFRLDLTPVPWGCRYHADHGVVAPPDFLEVLRPFDAILLGALGDPRCLPDHVTLEPLVRMRQAFDQYACVRPARLYPGVPSPLGRPGDIDMVVVRENSEGEYFSCGGRFHPGEDDEVAIQTAVHTRRGIERVLRFGFELAVSRRGRLTMVTKSNALRYGMVLWDEVLEKVRADFPQVRAERQHVDAAAMSFVRRPAEYDVVVASNLFGDILTDLSGAITGSIGMNPSANINPERRFPSMFEPVHGSAPDIAGQGIANPTAAVLSTAMMLEWLGEGEGARRIRSAVAAALAGGA